MKRVLSIIVTGGLLLIPFAGLGQAQQAAPPVAQALVREGEFALKLATALKLGTPETEAQAEGMLTSVGIAPKNEWIADYPMTPIIIGQVQNALVAAAALKKLPVGEDEALQAFEGLTAEFGLAIAPRPEQYAEDQPPSGIESVPPPVIDEYYYNEGPPVVTYYPPPWDYYYLYGWVPYPFWCSGFFFPGFFILNDFHAYHGHHHHGHDHHGYHHHDNHLISNHYNDPKTHASFRVDPTTRTTGTAARTPAGAGSRAFASREARMGAASIYNRSGNGRTLSQPGNTGRQYRGFQNPSTGSGAFASREARMGAASIYNRSGNGRTLSQPGNTGRQYRGFQNPSTGSGRSFARSFSRPSSGSFSAPSASGRGSFGGYRSGRSSGGYNGGGGFGGSHGGGRR
jgi:hypothetical protein